MSKVYNLCRLFLNFNGRKDLALLCIAIFGAYLVLSGFGLVSCRHSSSQQSALLSKPRKGNNEQRQVHLASEIEPPRSLSERDEGKIWLADQEIALTVAYLRKSTSYLEWGSGGSTVTFPKLVRGPAASIEHQSEWCKSMPKRITDAGLSVDLRCVPVKHKSGDGNYALFRSYVNEIQNLNRSHWDFVFIDGRARVACSVRVLPYLSQTSVVAVHDFSRQFYHEILNYYDVLAQISGSNRGERGIVMLRRKGNFNWIQGRHNETLELLESESLKGRL